MLQPDTERDREAARNALRSLLGDGPITDAVLEAAERRIVPAHPRSDDLAVAIADALADPQLIDPQALVVCLEDAVGAHDEQR